MPPLNQVDKAIAIARRTRPIVWQNIIIVLAVKVVFIALSAIALGAKLCLIA